jgi:hypothetical protein
MLAFHGLERLKLHVMPVHFYSPIAERRWLQSHPEFWRRRVPLAGVHWDLERQLEWLSRICATHLHEVAGFSFIAAVKTHGVRFHYGLVEAQVLHCAIRSLAPRLIVEIGSGASTVLMANAAARNSAEGRGDTRIIAIDPWASSAISPLAELRREPVQATPDEFFGELRAGDLLFIDSTHAVKTGSELSRLYLELIPRLSEGVLIHIHDIYLPYLYSPWVLSDLWDWQETVLVAALLTGNTGLQVLCCQSALHDAMPQHLRAVLPDYRPIALHEGLDDQGFGKHYPSSLWLRTVTQPPYDNRPT